jgi:hypothetical protein
MNINEYDNIHFLHDKINFSVANQTLSTYFF